MPRRAVKDRFVVKKSPIHGRGVFASSSIRKGTHIGTYVGEPADENDTYVLWVETDEGGEVGIDGTNELRFLNHSDEPNAEFDGPELYALRTIRVGEEILFYYGDNWDAEDEED